jgi:quercetin dioxygenase-like cupin family protein
MGTVKQSEVTSEYVARGRRRYVAHTDRLMVVVVDFDDGPTAEPDPPHTHPHEQVTYVAAGEILLFLNGESTHLGPGDLFTVPPNVSHTIQLLTRHVRLVDAFTPLREDFLGH